MYHKMRETKKVNQKSIERDKSDNSVNKRTNN